MSRISGMKVIPVESKMDVRTMVNSLGQVVIDYGELVRFVRLDPESVRKFALYLMKRANEAEKEVFFRCSGDCVCDVCGDEYRHHPHDMKELDHNGEPFLRVRCDGRRLKL
jgi:hypothetical protein